MVENLFGVTVMAFKTGINYILYRVDGDHHMGLGHLVRARALCGELKRRGIEPVIITRASAEIIEKMFTDEIIVEYVPDGQRDVDTVALVQSLHKAPVLIQDIRDTDTESVQFLQRLNMLLVHFDDLGTGRTLADILIDANIPASRASEFVMPVCYFGEQYMVMAPEIEQLHSRSKEIPVQAHKLLVSFGGSDPRNLTPWMIELLERKFRSYDITIVTGQGAAQVDAVDKLCKRCGFRHLHNISTMPAELFAADIAVISGGVTLYEAAACGTPAVVLPQVKHQTQIAQRFGERGICVCPINHHDLHADAVSIAVSELIHSQDKRRAMSAKGKEMVDGKGVKRIASILQSIYTKTFGETTNAQVQ